MSFILPLKFRSKLEASTQNFMILNDVLFRDRTQGQNKQLLLDFLCLGLSPYCDYLEAKGTRSEHTENTPYLLRNNIKYILGHNCLRP